MARSASGKTAQRGEVRRAVIPCTIGIECVRAHRFELVDKAGRICGGLGFTDQGNPLVALMEERDGKVHIWAQLVLDKRGPGLTLSDKNGTHRVNLSVNDGHPAVLLNGADGRPRLGFFLAREDYLEAKTWDSRGREVEFVRRAFPQPSCGGDNHRLLKLTSAGKKAEFAEVLAEYGNIHEGNVVDEVWRLSRREVKAKGNSKRRGKPRGG